METIGYVVAIAIGVSLGMIGGGGSILTIPLLVYIFGIDPVLATVYSLFIVGSTSLVGGIPKYTQGLVNLKTALLFGIPSILSVLLTRAFIAPAIPTHILRIGNFHLTKPVFLMLLFASLMIGASLSMIKDRKSSPKLSRSKPSDYKTAWIMLEGILVGLLTGLVGAGGGFLIIPALIMFGRLPMKIAVGTSLIIIAANSLIGFLGGLAHHRDEIDWKFMITITLLAISGIFIGHRISKKWDGEKLKKNFGRLILVLGIMILLNEGIKIIKM
ncbi:sulfite exporter TauE/SafE family protein [Leadbetterella sp. DM7]|uniref:sulfite exporter TauE/SafE family protein n=1 Tax=Leadbetterella sp. DM7 TaxID=3235085 RepID=UPI00349E5E65